MTQVSNVPTNEHDNLKEEKEERIIIDTQDSANAETKQDLDVKFRRTLLLINTLPPSAQAILLKTMTPEEYLIFLEQPDFWKVGGASMIVSGVGTIVFLVLLVLIIRQTSVAINFIFFFAIFPILLIVTIVSYVQHKKGFVAFTNRRLIVNPGLGTQTIMPYNKIIEVTRQTNYLHCREELAIRRYSLKDGRPKVSFLYSVQNLDKYEEFLKSHISLVTHTFDK
jgi:uncharacterized integral membrane protein